MQQGKSRHGSFNDMHLGLSLSWGRTVTILKVGVAVLVVATMLFWLVDLLEGPFYSLSTKTWPPARRGAKLIASSESVVKGVDAPTSTVRIASGFLGLASLPLVISPQTVIAVKGKLGGLADLDRHQRVRVAYEILPDRLLATRVDVLDKWSQPSDAVVSGDGAVGNEVKPPRAPVRTPVAAPPVSPSPRPSVGSATAPSRQLRSPSAVPQRVRTTTPAPATEHPTPSPTSPPRTVAEDPSPPLPVTPPAVPAPSASIMPATDPAPAPAMPRAPQARDDAPPTRADPRRSDQAP